MSLYTLLTLQIELNLSDQRAGALQRLSSLDVEVEKTDVKDLPPLNVYEVG